MTVDAGAIENRRDVLRESDLRRGRLCHGLRRDEERACGHDGEHRAPQNDTDTFSRATHGPASENRLRTIAGLIARKIAPKRSACQLPIAVRRFSQAAPVPRRYAACSPRNV